MVVVLTKLMQLITCSEKTNLEGGAALVPVFLIAFCIFFCGAEDETWFSFWLEFFLRFFAIVVSISLEVLVSEIKKLIAR